jgi:hypothetical protein
MFGRGLGRGSLEGDTRGLKESVGSLERDTEDLEGCAGGIESRELTDFVWYDGDGDGRTYLI